MKNIIILTIACACFFMFQVVVTGQDIARTDIIITPKTTHSFGFSGMVGGKNKYSLSWSIGNNVPFKLTPSSDLIFSTFYDGAWKEGMRLTTNGNLRMKSGTVIIASPDGTPWGLFVTNGGVFSVDSVGPISEGQNGY